MYKYSILPVFIISMVLLEAPTNVNGDCTAHETLSFPLPLDDASLHYSDQGYVGFQLNYENMDWCTAYDNQNVVQAYIAVQASAVLTDIACCTILVYLSNTGLAEIVGIPNDSTPETISSMGMLLHAALERGDLDMGDNMTATGPVLWVGEYDEYEISDACFNFDAMGTCNEGECQVEEDAPVCVCPEDGDEGTYCDQMDREQLILIIVLCAMVGAAAILVTVLCTLVFARRKFQKHNSGILRHAGRNDTKKRPVGPPFQRQVYSPDPMMLPAPPPPKMSLPMPDVDDGQDIHGSSGCVAIHQPVAVSLMPWNRAISNGYLIESSGAGKAIADRSGAGDAADTFGLGLKNGDATVFRINSDTDGYSWEQLNMGLKFGAEDK